MQELLLERVHAAAALLPPRFLRLAAGMVEGWKHKRCLLACFLCMVIHEAHGRNCRGSASSKIFALQWSRV